jgi:hypothetical protein
MISECGFIEVVGIILMGQFKAQHWVVDVTIKKVRSYGSTSHGTKRMVGGSGMGSDGEIIEGGREGALDGGGVGERVGFLGVFSLAYPGIGKEGLWGNYSCKYLEGGVAS